MFMLANQLNCPFSKKTSSRKSVYGKFKAGDIGLSLLRTWEVASTLVHWSIINCAFSHERVPLTEMALIAVENLPKLGRAFLYLLAP